MFRLPFVLLFATAIHCVRSQTEKQNLNLLAQHLFGKDMESLSGRDRIPINPTHKRTLEKARHPPTDLAFINVVRKFLLQCVQGRIDVKQAWERIVDHFYNELNDEDRNRLLRKFDSLKVITKPAAPQVDQESKKNKASDLMQVKEWLEIFKDLVNNWHPYVIEYELSEVKSYTGALPEAKPEDSWTSDNFVEISNAFQNDVNLLLETLEPAGRVDAELSSGNAKILIVTFELFCKTLDSKGFPNMKTNISHLKNMLRSNKNGNALVRELAAVVQNVAATRTIN